MNNNGEHFMNQALLMKRLDSVDVALNLARSYKSTWAIQYWSNVRNALIRKYAH